MKRTPRVQAKQGSLKMGSGQVQSLRTNKCNCPLADLCMSAELLISLFVTGFCFAAKGVGEVVRLPNSKPLHLKNYLKGTNSIAPRHHPPPHRW